jgi:hypothetical protein
MRPYLAFTLLAVATLAVGVRALAQDDPEKPEEEAKKPKLAYTGEITELESSSFRIKPWDPDLPKRVQVTAGQATRYFKQDECKRDDIKPGDFVFIVEQTRERPYIRPKKDETPDERAAREAKLKEMAEEIAKKPGKALLVLRLWPAGDADVTPELHASASALFLGSHGFFQGFSRGSVNVPKGHSPRTVGIVKTVRPLVVMAYKRDADDQTKSSHSFFRPIKPAVKKTDEEKVKQEFAFEPVDKTVWIDLLPMKPEQLKKGHTVVVQTPTPIGTDGTLQALMIAECPAPYVPPKQERKLILRERGERGKKD